MISLANFNQKPRDYQWRAIEHAHGTGPGESRLLSSPTGTGKGTMELAFVCQLLASNPRNGVVIATPSLEVVRGYLERCGATQADLTCTNTKLAELGQKINVYTPIRLRNRLRRSASFRNSITHVICDEAHHHVESNAHGEIRRLLPAARFVGFTATPFRGTPKETHQLREVWGEPHVVLTVPEAIANGSWALPGFRVVPLVDDDLCGVRGGDLDADEVALDTVVQLADLIDTLDLKVPTCVTLPSVAASHALMDELEVRDYTPRLVIGTTATVDRAEAYAYVAGAGGKGRKKGTLLVSVNVLGEGVDLPWLRRWIDATPTLSPVRFMQRLGRITRPNEIQPEYLGTNRNLERHGYLLQGALPLDVIRQAQEAFGKPSDRHARAGLIKGVRKLKPIELPLAGGVKGTMWALWTPAPNGGCGYERCVMLDPTSERTISAKREIRQDGHPDGRWGKWEPAPLVGEELKEAGFRVSKLKRDCTEGQLRWWRRDAGRYGLDDQYHPSGRQFFALPVLAGLQESFGSSPAKPPAPKPAPAPRPAPKPPAPLPSVHDGYYTVVHPDKSHTTYRVRTQPLDHHFAPGKKVLSKLVGPDDYKGMAFIRDDGHLHVWRSQSHQTDALTRDWGTIAGDHKGAGLAYALQSNNCYVCGRTLTHPASICNGIGPICAAKVGAP